MKLRNAPVVALTLLFACGNAPIDERAVSSYGFYSTPEAIIAALEPDARGYQEHFVLGLAYKKQKKYKDAILHFANSCFKSQRDDAAEALSPAGIPVHEGLPHQIGLLR